jgi:hypothetical protein
LVSRDINSAIVRVSTVGPEGKINIQKSIIPQSNIRIGGFASLKSFGSKTETGFTKPNTSSNELNNLINKKSNFNRPTTGNSGSRIKTLDSTN